MGLGDDLMITAFAEQEKNKEIELSASSIWAVARTTNGYPNLTG